MLDWLIQNKEWLFSGLGVVVLSTVVGFLFKNKGNQQIKAGDKSTNIQGGRDVKVSIGGKNDE